jgi:hypothetical protein
MLRELGMTFGRNSLLAQVIDPIQTWNAFMRFSTIQILAPVSFLIEGQIVHLRLHPEPLSQILVPDQFKRLDTSTVAHSENYSPNSIINILGRTDVPSTHSLAAKMQYLKNIYSLIWSVLMRHTRLLMHYHPLLYQTLVGLIERSRIFLLHAA